MARYPYNPGLPAPGKWFQIDFTNPGLKSAVRMLVKGIEAEVNAYLPPAGVTLKKSPIRSWDGETIQCYIFEPENPAGELPSMLYCHGGGFFLPIQPMMMQLSAYYAAKLGIRVYLPEYRIWPEYRNPYPFRDCLAVLSEVQKQSGPYLLYGESAGGTLAAGLALWTRDQKERAAAGISLVYPVLDQRCSRYPSMRQYSEAAWPLKNNLAMWREYLANGKADLDDYIIPMQNPDLSGLPQIYLEPQQIDILRDEAIAFGERITAANGVVKVNLIQGSYHGFDAAVEHPLVQNILEQRVSAMKNMLNGSFDSDESVRTAGGFPE